jgi:hypothetical protein
MNKENLPEERSGKGSGIGPVVIISIILIGLLIVLKVVLI